MSLALRGLDTHTAERFVREAARMSGGGAQIKLGEADASDGWVGPAHSLVDLDAAFAYFAGLPCETALPANAYAAWIAAEGGGLLDGLAAAHELKCFIIGRSEHCGVWSATPLDSATALHGRRVWTQGLARDVARGLGGIVVTSGDGNPRAEATDIIDFASLRLASERSGALRLVAHRGLTPHGGATVVTFPREAWRRMDAATRRVITKVAADHRAWRSPHPPHGSNNVALSLPRDLVAAANAIAAAVVAEIATRNGAARIIDRSYQRALRASRFVEHSLTAQTRRFCA